MFGNDMTDDDLRNLYDATIVDENGEKVGGVGQIYLDDQTNRPTWATAKTGLFGTKETFIPLADASITGSEIRVPYSKSYIKDAPNVDAEHHISEQEEDDLYRYYNINQGVGVAGGGADFDPDHGADGGADRGAGFDVDRGADGGADRGAGLDVDRGADRRVGDGDSVVRREEELRVGTERVATGRVRLRKHVVTEQQTVTVPVEREEVRIEREPVTGDVGGRIGDDEDISVTLHAERPVVEKETVAKERIGLSKETVTEQQRVTESVAKEQVDIDREGTRDTDRIDRDTDRR